MGTNIWREVEGIKTEFGGRTGRVTNGLAVKGDGEKTEGLDPSPEGWV